jgi:hypothetical protein
MSASDETRIFAEDFELTDEMLEAVRVDARLLTVSNSANKLTGSTVGLLPTVLPVGPPLL